MDENFQNIPIKLQIEPKLNKAENFQNIPIKLQKEPKLNKAEIEVIS